MNAYYIYSDEVIHPNSIGSILDEIIAVHFHVEGLSLPHRRMNCILVPGKFVVGFSKLENNIGRIFDKSSLSLFVAETLNKGVWPLELSSQVIDKIENAKSSKVMTPVEYDGSEEMLVNILSGGYTKLGFLKSMFYN